MTDLPPPVLDVPKNRRTILPLRGGEGRGEGERSNHSRPRTVQAVFGTSLNLFTNGNGQLGLNPATGPCAIGSTVQLTAVPAPGAYFFGWAGAAGGFNNPLSITVTNASGLTALFGALNASQVSRTVLPKGNGTVSVSPGKNVRPALRN